MNRQSDRNIRNTCFDKYQVPTRDMSHRSRCIMNNDVTITKTTASRLRVPRLPFLFHLCTSTSSRIQGRPTTELFFLLSFFLSPRTAFVHHLFSLSLITQTSTKTKKITSTSDVRQHIRLFAQAGVCNNIRSIWIDDARDS